MFTSRLPSFAARPSHISSGYARLLVSDPKAHGLPMESPLTHMVDHLTGLCGEGSPFASEYRAVLGQLRFAQKLLGRLDVASTGSLMSMPLFGVGAPLGQLAAQALAGRVVRHLRQHDVVLLPCFTLDHAMYMQIVRAGDNTYAIRIYNTSGGPFGHVRGPGRKAQTQYEVRGVALASLSQHAVAQLLRACNPAVARTAGSQADILSIYRWAQARGTAHNPADRPMQAEQRVGNCTHKAVLAFLRYNLSSAAYDEAWASLMERTAERYRQSPHPARNMHLADRLDMRARELRAKAQAGRSRDALLAAAGGGRYLVVSHDRPAMVDALVRAARMRGKACMLSYRPDARALVLSTLSMRGLRDEPVDTRPGPAGEPVARTHKGEYTSLQAMMAAYAARDWYVSDGTDAPPPLPFVPDGSLHLLRGLKRHLQRAMA